MKKETILNVAFDNFTEQGLLANLKEGILVTPNVDHIIKMQKDKTFYDIVKQADFVVCDSKIVYLASKLLGRPLPEAIPGSGFFPHFYMYHKDDEYCKIFLLGGLDGVAQKAQKNINKKVDREIIVGAYSPSFGFENNEEENNEIVKMIEESSACVVLVGVGCPKQEKWIYAHKNRMPNVKIWMALGATIDFEAGNIKRAPKIFQKLALEWLYRLCSEPKRLWRRYLIDDTRFFWLLLKDKVGAYRDPFE